MFSTIAFLLIAAANSLLTQPFVDRADWLPTRKLCKVCKKEQKTFHVTCPDCGGELKWA
jgi:predicted amidophosphoribosyltransferase